MRTTHTPPTAILLGFAATLAVGAGVNGIVSLSSGAALSSDGAALSVGAPAAPVGIPDAGADSTGSLLTSPVVGAPSAANPTSPDRLLLALRDTESLGSDVSRPNRKGALGPYQFKRDTWNDHARGVPWAQAVDEPTARVVAVRYLAWLDRTITKWQGKPATLDQVLAAWNGGIGTLRSVGFDPAAMPYEESRSFPGKVRKAMEEQR